MNLEKKLIVITEWLLTRPRVAGIFAFLFLLFLIGLFTNQRYQIIKENEHREMTNMLNAVKQNLEQSLRNSYTTALTLALTINDKGEPKDFEKVAKQLINSGTHFKALQLVPKGVIKYMYPIEGNEGAINTNIFEISKENTYRALQSIKSKKMYFLGPNNLRQGGVGIVGRLPLYRKNEFWGFSAVVISLDTFFKEVGINSKKDSKYYFQFSQLDVTNNKEQFYLSGSQDFSGRLYESVFIADGNWRLHLIAKNRNVVFLQVAAPTVFGVLLAVLCSLLVTQLLKRAEQKMMLESWVRIESLINTIDGIVWEANPDNFEFTFISKKVQHILGYSPEEWLSSKTFWSDHLYPEDREMAIRYCTENTRNNKQHDFEYRMVHKNGEIVWLRDIVNVVSEDGRPVLLRGIMIDIGENKRAAKALNDSFDLVSEQNKRLLNFSYIVSHNLRSHTSNIQAISGLIELTDDEQERKELVGLMKTVSGSLNETLVNLNEVVNIQASIDVIRNQLNLRLYINRTIDVLNDQILLKRAKIVNNIPEHFEVDYNPAYLESILLNFLFNAIRYSHPDRDPVIELELKYENGQSILFIKDNGIGIDLNKNGNQLFGMYKTFNGNPDSKGVGLFISKNQIEAMGGKVAVESELHIGSTFKIYFK